MTRRAPISNPRWRILWLAWIAMLAIAFVTADWLYVVALLYFCFFEGLAIVSPSKGDTFSESVWAFDHHSPARLGLTFGASGYMGLNLFRLCIEHVYADPTMYENTQYVSDFIKMASAIAFIGGAGVWLFLHFKLEGAKG